MRRYAVTFSYCDHKYHFWCVSQGLKEALSRMEELLFTSPCAIWYVSIWRLEPDA